MDDESVFHTTSGSRVSSTPLPASLRNLQLPQGRRPALAGGVRSSDVSSQVASLGLGKPPLSRKVVSPQGEGSSSGRWPGETHPRVTLLGGPSLSPNPIRARVASDTGADCLRGTPITGDRRSTRRAKGRSVLPVQPEANDNAYSLKSFSDEYDLANEDPRILEDIQRALKMKARREARTKLTQVPTPSGNTGAKPTATSPLSSRFSPTWPPTEPQPSSSAQLDLDFSPSVGTVSLHPVPSSIDGGAILDWAIPTSEDEKSEKRWRALSIKRKGKDKDKPALPLRKDTVERQDALYTDKIFQLKARAGPITLRKAAITRDQLERQYQVLLTPPKDQERVPNLLTAARWYDSQDMPSKVSLEKAEPLTWLKHLVDRSKRKPTTRLPWHVTALMLEECAKPKRAEALDAVFQSGVVGGAKSRPSGSSSRVQLSGDKSPSSGSLSWTPPSNPLEPSLSRKQALHDGISFEPIVDSGRESATDSKLSFDNPISNWVNSRGGGTTSPRSSTPSSVPYSSWPPGTSPNNSRLNFKEFAQRMRRKPHGGSDGGLSSARNSISEHSLDEDRPIARNKTRRRHSSLQILSRGAPPADEGPLKEPSDVSGITAAHSDGDIPSTARPVLPAQHSPAGQGSYNQPNSTNPLIIKSRFARRRLSLPSPSQFVTRQSERHRRDADEERERREYEHKAQMLEDTLTQNHRIRQVLQRISAHVKEYGNVQMALSERFGVNYFRLSPGVLDVFNHDPSAVTGRAKSRHVWRAVEDIHERVIHQREVLRSFVTSLSAEALGQSTSKVLEPPIVSLVLLLEQLEARQTGLVREAEVVAGALQSVKTVQTSIKREYNDTLGHTSLIYPELTQIITLEESYRNNYQQLWNIGLDALTVILDTVTPFWRNYGKVIGEDMQDFLIVPWYRHEFTGEASWYPIKSFPRRSLRHWVGLALFSALGFATTALQFRAAISTTFVLKQLCLTDIGVRWFILPFFLLVLIVQWCAVLFESLLLLTQAGILIWWLGWLVHIFH